MDRFFEAVLARLVAHLICLSPFVLAVFVYEIAHQAKIYFSIWYERSDKCFCGETKEKGANHCNSCGYWRK